MKKKNLMLEILKLIGVLIIGYFLWVIIFAAFSPEESEIAVEPFKGASMVFGFITAIVILLVLELNAVNLLRQRAKQSLNNITITNKRSSSLLDKANRVAEKYMVFEMNVVSSIASTMKPEKNKSKRIKNSSTFEQRLNEFPELKSNNSVMELLNQLRESENIVANFKLEHNNFVAQYNYQIHSFPAVMFKPILKLKEMDFYSDDTDLVSDEDLGI